MAKRLVVCCDGTWNDPDDRTNISWLHDNVADDPDQKAFYDAGVGTKWYDEKRGVAFGRRVVRERARRVPLRPEELRARRRDLCFGFSRGAFTARSLCGLLQTVGRVPDEDVDEAYFFYRINEPDEEPNIFERLFEPDTVGPVSVKMLGVFDTVGSLGVPLEIKDDYTELEGSSLIDRARLRLVSWVDRIGDRLRRPITGFHDTRLGPMTEHAYHALAIDERRAPFAPTLWTAAPGRANRVTADGERQQVTQEVQQVWFAGVHSDVGGGYEDAPRLADIPLLWMVEKASRLGLTFRTGAIEGLRKRVDALAPQHDSYTRGWAKIHERLGKEPIARPMNNLTRQRENPAGDAFPAVNTPEAGHPSVRARFGQSIGVMADQQARNVVYKPANLPPGMPVAP